MGGIFQNLAAEILTNWARLQIMGADPTTGAGGKDVHLAGALGSVLGGAVGGPIGSVLGGALAGKLFKFADGGLLGAGIPAMVGDSHQAANGEWVVPRVPSLAIPAGMLDQIAGKAVQYMGGGSTGDTTNHFHIQAKLDSQLDIAALGEQLAWHLEQRQKVA